MTRSFRVAGDVRTPDDYALGVAAPVQGTHATPNGAASAGATAPQRRTTGRRSALPNGRAVVGGLLVAAAAVGTYAAWSAADDGPSTAYAVAARDLAVGEVLEAGDVELVAMDVPASVAAAAFDEERAGLLVGQVAVAPLAAGELVQRSAVVVPEGDAAAARQLSFPIDVSAALAGTLEEGERVDVVVTTGGEVDDAASEVVARQATVARVVGDSDDGRLVVLLSVSDDTDLLSLVTAARRGDLTLVRTTPGGA
jgi:Flp pilus assembly protein CpaB